MRHRCRRRIRITIASARRRSVVIKELKTSERPLSLAWIAHHVGRTEAVRLAEQREPRLTASTALDKQSRKEQSKRQREIHKEFASLERKIAQLDDHKQEFNQQLLSTTDASEAERLHNEIQSLQLEIDNAEQLLLSLPASFSSRSSHFFLPGVLKNILFSVRQ